MEIKQLKQVEVMTDVVCDVCNQSTKLEFATLSAIRATALRMMEKDMSCSYVRNAFFMHSQH
ncbi:hypothetical protein [Acinetobacter variabilis]|uniref:hypothetical protein n=1 Tax=Acinetobacter variabilis TaxID=70346 RepID=UPI0021CE2008